MVSKSLLLGTSVLASVLCFSALPALAQTAPAAQQPSQQTPPSDEEASEIDDIVVTGSRLRRERFDGPTPVTTVGKEEFEKTAVGNAIDVIEDIPLVGAGSNSRGANGQFGDNFAFADLFNLGTQRTLTLVNGRRFISGNQATVFVPDNATGAQVDISTLPPSLIERVEVTPLTGGAIYGADAVGGVINFILKDDFDGLEVLTQYGITDYGDGDRYRAAVTWGKNFYDDRANVTLALDYFKQELIPVGGERNYTIFPSAALNPRNGLTRDPAAFNPLTQGAAPPSAFLPGASDFQRANIFPGILARNGLFTAGGLLTTGNSFPAGITGSSFIIPNGPVSGAVSGRAADPAGFSFFAPTSLPTGVTALAVITALAPGAQVGLTAGQQTALAINLLQRNRPTPAEYYAANPTLNPLLFVGTFYSAQTTGSQGPLGLFPTIANTNPATSALFPRIAVPLQFNNAGALVPYNLGDASVGVLGTNFGGDGFSNGERRYGNLQSATERASFSAMTRFDVTDSITYKGEYLYSDIQYRSIGGANSNSPGGSTTAGNRNIPIFIDQNPYFGSANLAQINTLVAQGLTVPTLAGQRALYVGRALADISGPTKSGNDVTLFRTAHSLEGEFGLWGRRFYWDGAYVYGQNSVVNIGENLLDIEFALSTDVVNNAGGQPVCRQQTLAAPESIAIRNPGLNAINTTLSLVPTAAQVAACVPFNLFGENNATVTDALRDYIIADTGSENEARQHYLSASLGGELIRLPGGWVSGGAQIEWRNESLEFVPNPDFRTGAARNTTGAASNGELRFLEYGYELTIPIFGDDFTLPLFQALDLSGAYRIVDRDQSTQTSGFAAAPGVTDTVYQVSLRWQLNDDLQFRANKSTSVRSASIIELYGAPGSGFVNTIGSPCTLTLIGSGPNPALRRENCISAVVLSGAAADRASAATFLNTYTGTGGSRPAATTGNPFLNNEQSEAQGYGVTYTPSFIPRLTLAADYYEAEIKDQVGLVGPPVTSDACYDSADFPNSSLSGTPACDLFLIGVRDPLTGNFVNPSVNPLTGRPVAPVTAPGAPAFANAPFETSFFFFPNFNLAATRLRALTLEARYNFSLEELMGSMATNWGDLNLSVSAYNLQHYDRSSNGTFLDINTDAGEPGFNKWEFRADIGHRVGRFDQRLSLFRSSGTVANSQTNPATFPEQADGFKLEGYITANYSASYSVRDNISVRMTVNNLFDYAGPREDLGIVGDVVGRTFLFTMVNTF